jgi:hypothetical protein
MLVLEPPFSKVSKFTILTLPLTSYPEWGYKLGRNTSLVTPVTPVPVKGKGVIGVRG